MVRWLWSFILHLKQTVYRENIHSYFKVILPGNYTDILKLEIKVVMVFVLDWFFFSCKPLKIFYHLALYRCGVVG